MFWVLVWLVAGLSWVLLSFVFPIIGKFVIRLMDDTKNNISIEEENKEENKDE